MNNGRSKRPALQADAIIIEEKRRLTHANRRACAQAAFFKDLQALQKFNKTAGNVIQNNRCKFCTKHSSFRIVPFVKFLLAQKACQRIWFSFLLVYLHFPYKLLTFSFQVILFHFLIFLSTLVINRGFYVVL